MASVLNQIKHYQQSIEKYAQDEQKILKCINRLYHLGVTVQHLQETGVGRTINALRKEPGDVGTAARALVHKWKLMVASEETSEPEDHEATNYNGQNPGKDSDDNVNQSRNGQDKSKYESNKSSKENDYRQINGHHNSSKRKYHSSEESEPDTKKSRQFQTDSEEYDIKPNIKIKEEPQSESDDKSDSQSDSDSSDSSEEETKAKKVIVKKEPPENHRSSSSKQTSYEHVKVKKEPPEIKENSKDHKELDKKTKHHKDLKHSHEKSSSKESHSSSHKHSKDKENSYEKHKTESSKSSDKEKHSSGKHKSSSSNHSEKHRSSSSHKQENNEKSRNEKQLSDKHQSKSEKDKSSHSHKSDKHKSKSSSEKEVKDKHRSKDNSSSSKSKQTSVEKEKTHDKSSSSKEKSSHSHSKDRSKDKKHSPSSESKSKSKTESREKDGKHKSSSSHKSSKSSSSKSKDNEPKKKNSEDSDDGIGCESGASFAEALGMVSPAKPKKKSHVKDVSSPLSSSESNDLGPASLLAPTTKLAPLPPLEISALPEISPNYRPRPPPKLLSHFPDEDPMNAVISSKNKRTKVYSGNKLYGKVPTLYEMCVEILQEHIDALEYTGGVPYEILKPIVDKTTPQQLFMLEHYNPYLLEDTDHLWQKFCKKDFGNKQPQEMETYREMYMRCQEEQEQKLKMLTANIRIAQEAKKAPIKQTKMAYVDTVVKPPRNIARKQAMHGTARAAAASPAARVSSLAAAPLVMRAGQLRPPPAAPSAPSFKPKKAPLMQKALQFMRGRKR